jgi:hypothetical protein
MGDVSLQIPVRLSGRWKTKNSVKSFQSFVTFKLSSLKKFKLFSKNSENFRNKTITSELRELNLRYGAYKSGNFFFIKFGAIPGTLFIYFCIFLTRHTLIQYSLPELGINSCVWVIIHPAGPRAECRVGFEPGAAVQQPSALTTELRCTLTTELRCTLHWATLHPALSYAAP